MSTKFLSLSGVSRGLMLSFKFLTISCEAYQVLGAAEGKRSP